MNRRVFLSGLSSAALSMAQTRGSRPNILLVVADDLGYGDLGCYGQKRIQTPHLDRLASEGTRFTQAYAGSTVCAPSRCALMTGLHTGHARMRGNTATWLRKQDVVIPEVLKAAGYRTGVIGKWSLGNLGSTGYPNDKGVDEWYGYFSQLQAHTYYPEMLLHNREAIELTGNWGTLRKQYAPDLFTDRAVKFIEETSQPWFLHLAYTTPHANNELGNVTKNGQEVPSDEPYTREAWPQVEKNFAAMVTRMDRDMGRVLAALKARGEENNTLVIFTSDNGPHKEGGHDADFFDSNGPLRGTKRDLYDGGIRVPAIARWPGVTPRGASSDFVWAFWDMLPTLAEVGGARAPGGLDGQSIVAALAGKAQAAHEYLYWEFHERRFAQGVRHKDWKAVRYGLKGALELYDLRSDLGESTDVAGRNPETVHAIERYLAGARTESADYPVKV